MEGLAAPPGERQPDRVGRSRVPDRSGGRAGQAACALLLRPKGRQEALGAHRRVRQGDADPQDESLRWVDARGRRQTGRRLALFRRALLLRLQGNRAVEARVRRVPPPLGLRDVAGTPPRQGDPPHRAGQEGVHRRARPRGRQDDLEDRRAGERRRPGQRRGPTDGVLVHAGDRRGGRRAADPLWDVDPSRRVPSRRRRDSVDLRWPAVQDGRPGLLVTVRRRRRVPDSRGIPGASDGNPTRRQR